MTNPLRLSWDEYFFCVVEAISRRADCRRAQVGAVIVSKDNRIVSTGYNGSPVGDERSCWTGDCPRGLLTPEELAHNTPDYSSCIALHAEQNAIAFANYEQCRGGTIYVTVEPCDTCAKLIRAAGIVRVVTGNGQMREGQAQQIVGSSP